MAEASSQDKTPPPLQRLHSQGRSTSEITGDDLLLSSHGISVNLPSNATAADPRPVPVKYMSAPAYHSPIRHHKRVTSRTRAVKETVNARSHYGSSGDDDGLSMHRINQYNIKQEIGRGSYGAVFLAVDQFGNEYAVKEFSKSRLRKRAQSNLLRQPNKGRRPGHLAAGVGFNSPLHRIIPSDKNIGTQKPFELIKEEIAIMKKLNHHNVVSLIEVLDDPQEDTLYMVLEMCKKGIVMKVGLDSRATPYSDEECRCWFRDMILGIEYLHAQGIIHRDIKPDNCLVTDEGVLKIVDFGVSEMFEKSSDMSTAKSAGSPAFMPPELCVAKHGTISGRPADIWSMGVTLYCLRYGHIPFERDGMLELYDCIRQEPIPLDDEHDDHFRDLMQRLLEKDPEKRITMPDLRKHPWVTKNGADPLCSEEENCAELVEPPTEAEKNRAITGNMANLITVMKAVRRFKTLVARKRPFLKGSILGSESRLTSPPQQMRSSRSAEAHDRRPFDQALVAEGIHRDIEVNEQLQKLPLAVNNSSVGAPRLNSDGHAEDDARKPPGLRRNVTSLPEEHHFRLPERSSTFPATPTGHAHDPLEDHLFLNVGASNRSDRSSPDPGELVVSESPSGIEENIYEQAYQDEMKRILDDRGKEAALYLNRRMDHREDLKRHFGVIADKHREAAHDKIGRMADKSSSGFDDIVRQAQSHASSAVDRTFDKVDKLKDSKAMDRAIDTFGDIKDSNAVDRTVDKVDDMKNSIKDSQPIDRTADKIDDLKDSKTMSSIVDKSKSIKRAFQKLGD